MKQTVKGAAPKVQLNIKKYRARWLVLLLLSLAVATGVFWWLKLVGITMAGEAFCGVDEHIHGEECLSLLCSEEHGHSAECYGGECSEGKEEHVHTAECYSDLTADLETEQVWEATMHSLTFSGNYAEDIVSVAASQLGYTESTLNFKIGDDGVRRGYNRYGEWFGNPYGDYGTMFVSFCTSYARFPEDTPMSAGAEALRVMWEQAGLYSAGKYPVRGDILFIDTDLDSKADESAVVTETDGGEILVVQGDVDGAVRALSYFTDDERIMGVGSVAALARTGASREDIARADSVSAMIEDLPSSEEVEAKLAGYEDADDRKGYARYFNETGYSVVCAFKAYEALTGNQPLLVADHGKLEALDWMRSSPSLLIEDIVSDAPSALQSVSTSEFIELNLYDYGSNVNDMYDSDDKYPGFQWNGGAHMQSDVYDRHKVDFIDFGNSMISDLKYGNSASESLGYSVNGSIIGNNGGMINALDVSNYGVGCRPIGMSLNSSISDKSADVLLRTLGSDGFPALADGTSLAYLFSQGAYATKKNTESVDGLFRLNDVSGAYYFNSLENHAQYSDNRFTVYDQIITPNFIVYPFGNFLPFNDITDNASATQVSKIDRVGGGDGTSPGYIQSIINELTYSPDPDGDPTKKQLLEMLIKYRSDLQSVVLSEGNAWDKWTARDAVLDYFSAGDSLSSDASLITDTLLSRMYNIDYDVDTDFFFGMDMHMTFMQPKDGMTGADADGDETPDHPMTFEFSGDDDVWVYVDGVLFLDLSGIHRYVSGRIDFANGKVHYYHLDTAGMGEASTEPYMTYTFAELLSSAGMSTDVLNEDGTFKDHTYHKFDFYYMERGSGSSVCRMSFNFPLIKRNTVSVLQEITADEDASRPLGSPFVTLQLLKADANKVKTKELFIGEGIQYTVYDERNEVVRTSVTAKNGIFVLKAGQRAEFSDIGEDGGNYYVRELIPRDIFDQYVKEGTLDEGTAVAEITVSFSAAEVSEGVTVGAVRYVGVDGPVVAVSDESTVIRVTNEVQTEKLGALSVTGGLKLLSPDQTYDGGEFEFLVTLDGEALPVGAEYTVTGADGSTEVRTVLTAGQMLVPDGGTATVRGIVAGSEYEVCEIGAPEGFAVVYENEKGTVLPEETNAARVTATNHEKGTAAEIPFTSELLHPDGDVYDFVFTITQVTLDDSGAYVDVENGYSDVRTVTVSSSDICEGSFTVPYVAADISEFPTVFYYRIAENGENAPVDVVCDTREYVARVAVTMDEQTGELTAVLESITEIGSTSSDGASGTASFVSTVVRSLEISNTVVSLSGDTSGSFAFELYASAGENALTGAFDARISSDTSADSYASVVFDFSGKAEITLMHGQTLIIDMLPYGTEMTVTEADHEGYSVKYSAQGGEEVGEVSLGDSASVTVLDPDGTHVSFINMSGAVLPATGGIGAYAYTLCGLCLMAIPLVYGSIARRKRERR